MHRYLKGLTRAQKAWPSRAGERTFLIKESRITYTNAAADAVEKVVQLQLQVDLLPSCM